MIKVHSKKTNSLLKKEINSIVKLKNTHWKYGVKSNYNWFKKNIRNNDIHNLIFSNEELIGYTLLRKRKIITNSYRKYIYFDTLIIKKKYRKKKFANILMSFNNKIIKKNKMIAFLICKKKMINFYKKNFWKFLDNKNFQIKDHSSKKSGMIFNNYKKKEFKNFKFFIKE